MIDENEEDEQYFRSERSFSFTAIGILPKIARMSEAFIQNLSPKEISILNL